ncbi:MAG: lysylphosphatidylglycerol synthase transmembrane domain-containing protein [Eubacterium sp.]|nr:lysylphosphatidylglycerol synthase transmembrane domain-containing protein [Eubacterium sp.]
MNSKQRKNLLNALFLIALMGITIWAVFKDQDLGNIIDTLSGIAPVYLLIGFILVILYVCSESFIIKYLLHTVHIRVPILDCIRYSFVGFFYSCITPSATGGQPMQIFYMKRQNIDIPTATIILMLVTIEYKFVLVFIGLAVVILGQGFIQHYMCLEVQFFLYLGIALNVFCVSFMSFLVFLPETAKFLITKGFLLLKKLHIMKEKNNRTERLNASMEMYKKASVFLRANKIAIINTTLISFVQRFFLFFITYITYRSFGLHTENAFTITLLQSVISISVDMLPLPGGMGISERLYLLIFIPVFGSATAATASLLMSRGFNYYILIVVSGIISLITHLTVRGSTPAEKE